MKIFNKIAELQSFLNNLQSQNKLVAFVPTMGALHLGHISLVEKAKQENDIVVVSIFVNPLQFNNKSDLEKYPRNIEQDIEILQKHDVDVLFVPDEAEIYPNDAEKYILQVNFGNLGKILEAKYRPGHFEGVAIVVKRLFEIVKPTNAYFGEKDFQQLLIIKSLVKQAKININIVACELVREDDGMAMSSRNQRLSSEERIVARKISKTLLKSKELANTFSVSELKKWVINEINEEKAFELEYFEIVNAENMENVRNWEENKEKIGCIALKIANVRLIDNVKY